MKFGRRFDNNKIPEWADFYVSYRTLKKLLSPYKIVAQYNNTISVSNFSTEDIQKLEYFSKEFEKLIFQDLEKVCYFLAYISNDNIKVLAFYTIKLNQIITKWRKLRINLIIYKQRSESLNPDVKNEYRSMLKESFQALIKEIKLLTDYMTVNLEAFQKIVKKQKKAVSPFSPKSDLKNRFEKYLIEVSRSFNYVSKRNFKTKAFKTRDRLNNFLFSVESDYIDFFHKNRSEGMNELRFVLLNIQSEIDRKIFQGNLISRNETFWFGLFFGFSALLILAIIVLIWDEGLDIDGDEIFTKIFPIFRGVGLLIIYLWLLAWNVYVWTSYHVNYKLIFRFNYHYSQLSEILTRASAFSTVLLVLLLWYLILEGQNGKLHDMLAFVPKEMIPLFVWICFLGYIFFPHRKMFNGQGRLYMFKLIKNIVKTPFISVNFPIVWATDQLVSFVLPLKDLEYTICFYTTYFFSDKSKLNVCHSMEGLSKGAIMAALPLIIRYLQCLRQAYDLRSLKSDAIVNSFKYLFSLFVAILSYLISVYDQNVVLDSYFSNYVKVALFQAWIIFAAISTIYSYAWDLKKDWGFLVPNARYKFLRNELSYNKPHYYYIAMVVNLVMRLAWVLSISPDVIDKIVRPELFALIVSFVEIFRRSVWNFLRVEKEHIANVGNFKAVPDMNLPFGYISYDLNLKEDELFNNDLKVMIENDKHLGKPVCVGDQNYNKASSIRKASLYSENNDGSMFKFIPEGEEYLKLKMLSKITLEPISALKSKDKDNLESELLQYKQSSVQFDVWAKEIKKFKQYIMDKVNSFHIIPSYKEIKIFNTVKVKADSPDNFDHVSTTKLMKKTVSRATFIALNEEAQEDEVLRPYFKKGDEEAFDSGTGTVVGSYKKLSTERYEGSQTPLLMEMKKLSIEQKKNLDTQ